MKVLLVLAILALTHGKHVKRGHNVQVPGIGRYAFYRTMERERDSGDQGDNQVDNQGGSRRVFGGEAVDLSTFPAMAALMDRFWTTRCSASVIKPYWALTAAHCVTSRVAYVRFNSRNPTSSGGDSAHVLYLYRHPDFKVVQEDEGKGMDVTLLHHDLGLIRTRDKMVLATPMNLLDSMAQFKPSDLEKKELTVLGYGKTNSVRSGGENLYAVKLLMVNCDRGSWFHCLCGMATPGQGQRGVCSGDSGGPVMYNNVQVGVTSMGPVECVSVRSQPPEGATSVFTSTYQYVDLINATIHDAEKEITRSRPPIEPVESPPIVIYPEKNTAANFLRIHIPIVVFSLIALFF